MSSFFLAHLNHSSDLGSVFPSQPVWKTCMRSIVCFDEPGLSHIVEFAEKNQLDLKILKEADAYQYLLEVICGLKSEIVGETQVLGQFKIFLSTMEKNHRSFYLNHYSLFQNLLQDCKELREKHIQNWGGSSYGSLTRKIVETTLHISVLGNGQLSNSLLPWLKQKHISVFGRTPKNTDELVMSLAVLSALKVAGPRSLVVAAPVDNGFLFSLLTAVHFDQVIDWRTETSLAGFALPAGSHYHSFQHLAEFMQTEKIKKQQHIDKLSEIIQNKIIQWRDRKMYRPKGWEDLC